MGCTAYPNEKDRVELRVLKKEGADITKRIQTASRKWFFSASIFIATRCSSYTYEKENMTCDQSMQRMRDAGELTCPKLTAHEITRTLGEKARVRILKSIVANVS